MKTIKLGNNKYEIINNYKDGYDEELVVEKYTDYFEPFDYILGDFSYDKLRLKGFYESNNSNVQAFNDIKNMEDYIKNYCSYECRYFLLKKI